MSKITAVTVLGLTAVLAACTAGQDVAVNSGEEDLRGISKTEAVSELTAVGSAIRAYYGPLEFKQNRFGFNLDAELAAAKAKIRVAKTEGDRVRPIYELLAKLHDGHISYQYPLPGSATSESGLPLLITPYEGSYVVDRVRANPAIAKGDILVSIDDLPVEEIARIIAPMVGDGNPDSEKIFVADFMTYRPFYFPSELTPKGPTAHVVVKKPDGTTSAADLPWTTKAGGLAGVPASVAPPATAVSTGQGPSAHAQLSGFGSTLSARATYRHARKNEIGNVEAGLASFGELQPFWMTAPVVAALGIHPVSPKTETLTAMGVTLPAPDPAAAPGTPPKFLSLGAYKYVYEGKTVLVVRIPAFEVGQGATPDEDVYGENIAWLAALLTDNLGTAAAVPPADAPADVVVLDDTENPGGAADYALALASLFATKPIPSLVQAMHADRKWLASYSGGVQQLAQWPDFATVYESRMRIVETAYDANKTLSDFIPLAGDFVGPGAKEDIDTILGANMLAPNPTVQWSKPVLILADDLSGSCGDFFPAILQNGGVAKTFGVRTMGLGGSVEPVLTQQFSGAVLSLTRGMGGPFNPAGAPKLIENTGVTPDFEHPLTIADFRAGFVDYAKSFSHTAATLTR